jgi:penicillin-binding protein 1A
LINQSRCPPKKQQSRLGIAPHFVELVRQTLEKDENGEFGTKGYDLYRDGLIIHTTLNTKIQRYANAAVEEHLIGFQNQFDKTWKWVNNKELLGSLLSAAIRAKADYIAAETEQEKRAISDKYKANKSFIDSVKRRSTLIQTGVVVLNPMTGAIVGMVGASPQAMRMTPEARYSLNHAVQIKRQPGSSFKPFVYASALEDGLSPSSLVESGPYSYTFPSGEVWSPSGSNTEGGPIPLSSALRFSINSVAARLITEHTTAEHVVQLARRCGIVSPLDAYPALALGAEEVRPLEITSAYGTFLNQGIHIPPFFITKIEDRMGNILYERKKSKKVIDAMRQRTAQSMVRMMEGVVNAGTASSIRQFYKYAAAGKTGTTNDYADAWFIGFTPELVAGIWTGFDNRKVKFQGWYGQGGRAAAPIFGRLMKKVYDDQSLGFNQKTFHFSGIPADSTVGTVNFFDPPPEGIIPSQVIDSVGGIADTAKQIRLPRLN